MNSDLTSQEMLKVVRFLILNLDHLANSKSISDQVLKNHWSAKANAFMGTNPPQFLTTLQV